MAEQARVTTENYIYKNCPIPGGGYVTGFISCENNLYCRTDIGGTYRYEETTDSWRSLIDHVTMEDPSETFPISVAIDKNEPDSLYIACGTSRGEYGKLAVSHDRGESFEYYDLPFYVHGNLNGRGTAERLIVDVNKISIGEGQKPCLIMASQMNGLWMSSDGGANWTHVDSMPEEYLTFAAQSGDGSLLVVAGAGVTTSVNEHLRGQSLYVSIDGGQSFITISTPLNREIEGVDLSGYVAQRYRFDDEYLYVTFSVMGRDAYVRENGYSCDGGSVIGGKVIKYKLAELTKLCSDLSAQDKAKWQDDLESLCIDITPVEYPDNTSIEDGLLEYGFGGIDITVDENGRSVLVVATICKLDGDCVYRSFDKGETWECILYDLDKGVMKFRTPYMRPECNGGHNLIHWLTDLKFHPFNANRFWFNSGTGVFRTDNACEDEVVFCDWSDGIEETVHLNLYSPMGGDVKLIDILGDLGGFAFRDLDMPCDNSFADSDGNRYITCINADYSDIDPNTVIVTPRGNWTGKTKGGLIISRDGCKTFERLELPFGLSEELDEAFRKIETPNVNSGWVAMSPNTKNIVWSVADGISLPVSRVVVSHDGGRSFKLVVVHGKEKGYLKVYSDRVNNEIFYGFDEQCGIYISTDAGDNFNEIKIAEFPNANFGLIDTINATEIRPVNNRSGEFYVALAKEGLWKLNISDGKAMKLTPDGEYVYRVGLGVSSSPKTYPESIAIYFAGTINGEYGFYRTEDEGETYTRLNTATQMFGDINSLEADKTVYGRFYIATGSRGVLYGEKVAR